MALPSRELIDLFLVLHLDGRPKDFFTTVSPRETAEAWCRVAGRFRPDDSYGEEAWALLVVSTIQDEECRRDLLKLLVEVSPEDGVLEAVGSGPLEDFLRTHDDNRVRWAFVEADNSSKFRFALSKTHYADLPAPPVHARQQAARVLAG